MSSRVFQSVIFQMKDATDRIVGVIDNEGSVIASTDLSLIGTNIGSVSQLLEDSDIITLKHNGKTYKSLTNEPTKGYAVFTTGEDETSKIVCLMSSIAIDEAGKYFEESHDKRSFVKTILSENILPGDLFIRAKELGFEPDAHRGVLVVRLGNTSNLSALDVIQEAFPDKQNDFVIAQSDTDIVLIKELPQKYDAKYLIGLADMIQAKLSSGLAVTSVIGVGTPAKHLRELAERYKEALIAIDIGRVFETGKTVICYENLGISRLIYQLPTTLCEIFLSEVFKRSPIESLDQETLFTIYKFFENNLNVSETSRKLFVHRNTLVYRLEKIRKITGLDLRIFDHAIVFKVALMVKKYLVSQESKY